MKNFSKHAIAVTGLLVILFLGLPSMSDAQSSSNALNLLFSDMKIRAELGTDCNTELQIKSNVTNIGANPIDAFDMRIDVRELDANNVTIDGVNATVQINNIENFIVLTIIPQSPIGVAESVMLQLDLTTQCLQEQVGLSSDGSMYLSHLIYYFRPLSQVNNLTFAAVLPSHAVLQTESTAPLFPEPTTNHTDGTGLVFVWSTMQLLPGQEIVYIVKYQMPASLLQTTPGESANVFLIAGAAALAGGAFVLLLLQAPKKVNEMKTAKAIKDSNLSDDEQSILKFIAKKGGSCPQREIYEEMHMSQSMVSMILTSLEQRSIVKRLKSGRENVVHILEE